MGLSRFKGFERGIYDDITYLDTYFLTKTAADNENLHFHEMVHIVQWRLLGAEFSLRCMPLGWRSLDIPTVRLKGWPMMPRDYSMVDGRYLMQKNSLSKG